MRTLVSLLEGAVQRGAHEVTVESGQPVVYTTARGTEAESSVLPRTELFDMIVAAVDDSQQVELAVGNPVEFAVEAGASWSIFAEPGRDGITVSARRAGGAPALEIDLDYGEGPVTPGFDLDEPQFDVSLDAPERPRPREPGSGPPSQLYVEALEVPAVDDDSVSAGFSAASSGPAPAAPFESGTWALADEDDFDVGVENEPDEDSLPTGFGDPPARYASEAPSDGHIGVPPDDDEDSEFDPFSEPAPAPPTERRHTLSPTVRAMDASPRPTKSTPPAPDAAVTHRELGAMRSPDADTHRELPSMGREPELNELTADVAEGSLVYVREPGFAETLAESFQAPHIIIDDSQDPREAWDRVRALPPGSIIIVRREDPSELLGGILRRLEEGYRVFVETHARTVEGARRVLLGISASDRAEHWLDAQLVFAIEAGEGGPKLVSS